PASSARLPDRAARRSGTRRRAAKTRYGDEGGRTQPCTCERKARKARRVKFLCVLRVLCVPCLLPFYGRRWLRADVVDHAIDALHFVDDTRRDVRQQIVRQPGPVGGHAVAALDGPDRDRVLVGALVAHDANALHWQQHRKTLPEFRIPSAAL